MELLVALVAATLALTALRAAWRRVRRPSGPVPIVELGPGPAHVHARVRADETARAPITGREAVAWSVVVEEERGALGWRPVLQLASSVPFTLEDQTGRVRVDASGKALELDLEERRGKGGPFRPLPAAVGRLMRRHGRGTQGVLFEKGFRWRERVLLVGAEVYARGQAQATPREDVRAVSVREGRGASPFKGYRSLEDELVIAGSEHSPVQIIEG